MNSGVESLCQRCSLVRVIESAKGSVFLQCTLAKTDERFSKYPPQPVLRCAGFQAESGS